MRSFMELGALFALLVGLTAQGAQIEIGFREVGGPLPDIGFVFNDSVQEAAQALQTRYGVEEGFRHVEPGMNGDKLIVVTSHPRYTRRIWDKMLRNGDAFSQGGRGFFVYQSAFEPPKTSYQNVGRINAWEGQTAYLPLHGFPHVTSFLVRVHKDCSVARGTVVKANQLEPIQNTMLFSTEKDGSIIRYVYSVNGGLGTRVSQLAITLAPKQPGFFKPHTNCSIDFFLPTQGGGGSVPESAGSAAPVKP